MISSFIVSYGYWAVFVGTLLEGESILLAAGFACHQGLMDWRLVLFFAVIGGSLGDLIAFLAGRWRGKELVARFPMLHGALPRIHALVDKYHTPFILFVRFLYGLRIAGPLVLGMSRVPFPRFALLNLLGAVLWAVTITATGYVFGLTLKLLLADLRHIEELVLIGLLCAGGLFWIARVKRAAHSRKDDK